MGCRVRVQCAVPTRWETGMFINCGSAGVDRSIARVVCWLACTAALAVGVWLGGCQTGPLRNAVSGDVVVVSPDGGVRVELAAVSGGNALGAEGTPTTRGPAYRVLLNGREVVGESLLSVVLGDGTVLGAKTRLEGVTRRVVREEFEQVSGKSRRVVSVANEVVLSLREDAGDAGEGRPRWEIVVRVADDGVALRYRFLENGDRELVVSEERTEFRLPEGAVVTALPLGSFTTSYERRYERGPAQEVGADRLIGLPLLAEVEGTGCVAITEAGLDDYAGMYLVRDAGGVDAGALTRFVSRLSPWPGEPSVAVRARRPHESPWRLLLVADTPAALLESDFVLALSEPCALDDVSWIRPGKTTFPWWNAFVDPEAPFEVGLNTATMLYYIDFCARAGILYHTLDGKDDLAWYGGPISWKGDDPTTAIDTIDLPAVLEHARARGVGIRVWMHWRAAQAHMERAFPLYHQWGIRGVMIDFMDRDDQEMVVFQRRLLELAAANQLTVVFHGVAKPTGLERTFPNLLSSEGVLNLEYDKWDAAGVTPDHEMTCVFTRMLAGPMDFHQGGTRTVPAAEFRPLWAAPVVIGTACRTLASYVVYQNHLPMIADYPSAYASYPLLDAVTSVPETWDDTRGLAGEVGEYVVVARRSARTWWLAAMTNSDARRLEVPLGFLGPGRYIAEVFEDELDSGRGVTGRTVVVGARDTLQAELAAGGAWVARIKPDDGAESGRGE